ncbi:MAG: hypothetical protein WDW36_008133 [Sanguina aurantia]
MLIPEVHTSRDTCPHACCAHTPPRSATPQLPVPVRDILRARSTSTSPPTCSISESHELLSDERAHRQSRQCSASCFRTAGRGPQTETNDTRARHQVPPPPSHNKSLQQRPRPDL